MKYLFLLLLIAIQASAQETLDITISVNGSNQIVMELNEDASFEFNQTLGVGDNKQPAIIIKNVFTAESPNLTTTVGGGTGISYLSNTTNSGDAYSMGCYGLNFGLYTMYDAVVVFPEHTVAFQSGDIITISAGTIISFGSRPDLPTINSGPYEAFIASEDFNSIAAPQVPLVPLSVKLTSFEGYSGESSVHLNWETSTETNNVGFEIEHTADKAGRNWKSVGFVGGNGTSDGLNKYNYTHLNPSDGQNYYRLKSIDTDSKFEYSGIISVNSTASIDVAVLPNPGSDIIRIKDVNEGTVAIVDILGKVVSTQNLSKGDINISDLNPGIFVAKIVSGGEVYIKKFVKN